MNYENISSKELREILIKKGKEVAIFAYDLHTRGIAQNADGNGLDEKSQEYSMIFEEMIRRSIVESFFWEYCSFFSYFNTYSTRFKKFQEENDHVDELFFLSREKIFYKNLGSGKLIIDNNDNLFLKHNHEATYHMLGISYDEALTRWLREQNTIKESFFEEQINRCTKEKELATIKLTSKNPFDKQVIMGFKSRFNEEQILKLYKSLRDEYIDCSENNFKAFLTGKVMTDRITWRILNKQRVAHKYALREFLSIIGFPITSKRVSETFCDKSGHEIQLSKPKKQYFTSHCSILESIIDSLS